VLAVFSATAPHFTNGLGLGTGEKGMTTTIIAQQAGTKASTSTTEKTRHKTGSQGWS